MRCIMCDDRFDPNTHPGGLLFGLPYSDSVTGKCAVSKEHLCRTCFVDVDQHIYQRRASIQANRDKQGHEPHAQEPS